MKCPFLLNTADSYRCELMEEIHGGLHPLVSASKCNHNGFITCPEYLDLMPLNEEEKPSHMDFDFPGILIRHVNRIGGPRALFEDLID